MKRKFLKILLVGCLIGTLTAAVAACGKTDSAQDGLKGNSTAEQTENSEEKRMLTLASGTPDNALGEEGDVCLVAETGTFYRKTESGWQVTEYENCHANGSTLTVTYADGSVGEYDLAPLDSECAHEALGEPYTVYPAKCVIPGIAVRYCSDCKTSIPVILPANGEHSYAEGSFTCADCGETNYFKDAKLGGRGDTITGSTFSVEGKYLIQTESHQTTDFNATDGKVVIPGTIDGKEVVIDEMAFGSETKEANTTINSLVIEEGVKVIGQRAFQNCTALESITLPESLTILGGDPRDGSSSTGYLKIFAGCTSLREVHFGSKVTIIGNQTFYGCSSLTSIDLPQSLKEIHNGAFQNTGLTHVEIPESVEMIDKSVFKGCSGLTSVQFGKDTFKGKDGNDEINGISTSLFADCTSLAEITLPKGIERIGSSAFQGCSALTGIEIPANVTAISDYAFKNCESIASLTFGEGSKLRSIGVQAFYCGGNDKPRNEKLQSVVLPEGLETIGGNAFTYCISLEWVVLPSTLQEFKGFYAFENCNSLNNLYYNGDSAAWGKIAGNSEASKKVCYYSVESQPGCWYWDDGGAPQIWE